MYITKGDIAIRRARSLVAPSLQRPNFQTMSTFCNLHGSEGKYINILEYTETSTVQIYKIVSCRRG